MKFAEFHPGQVIEAGPYHLSEAELLHFARAYDPQWFHVDAEASQQGRFQGLIASGWQTCGLMMRLYAEHYLTKCASLASPGVDELRWVRPVRPGDALSVRVTIQDAVASRSKPDRGVVTSFIEVLNQKSEVVLSMRAVNMIGRRNPG